MRKNTASVPDRDTICTPCRLFLFSFLFCVSLTFCSSSYGDAIDITFQVDMQRANDDNSFVIGQPLYVHCGYDSTATQEYDIPLQRVGFTFTHRGSATIDASIGDTLFYRYVTYYDEEDQEEHYFDYYDDSPFLSPKFKRKVALTGPQVSIDDFESSVVTSHRMPVFPNPNRLSKGVFVTWECDMRPAYYALTAGKQFVNKAIEFPIAPITDPDSIDILGVFINGTPTGMWQHWHTSYLYPFQMFDDGENGGDVTAGDSIYTIQFYYPGNHPNFLVSHYFKMGINGGDNEGGAGAVHMVNLDDSQSEVTVRFAWGEVDPNFYSEWDYDAHQMTSVHHHFSQMLPETFHLHQNYPNPFNPTTNIRFDLLQEKHVSLKIYNLLGQEIETLVYDELSAGQHYIRWTAASALPTGVYWCELKAGAGRHLIKLVLLK